MYEWIAHLYKFLTSTVIEPNMRYSSSPPGDLDISRMLSGSPYIFRGSGGFSSRTYPILALIIADPLLIKEGNCPYITEPGGIFSEIVGHFPSLKIYAPKGEELVEIHTALELTSCFRDYRVFHKTDLLRMAHKKGYASNQVFILDYWTRKKLESETEMLTININEFQHLDEGSLPALFNDQPINLTISTFYRVREQHLQKILRLCKIEKLTIECSSIRDEDWKLLQSHDSLIKQIKSIDIIDDSNVEAWIDFVNICPHLSSVGLELETPLDLRHLSCLKKAKVHRIDIKKLYGKIDYDYLKKFCPDLEEVILNKEECKKSLEEFPHIKQIKDFLGSPEQTAPIDMLNQHINRYYIFERFPKKIHMDLDDFTIENLSVLKSHIPELEVLAIENFSPRLEKELLALLKDSKKLSSLAITYKSEPPLLDFYEEKSSTLNFSHLRELSIHAKNRKHNLFQAFLNSHLKSLRILELENMDLSGEEFSQFCSRCPQLKLMTLENCQLYGIAKSLYLPELEKLEISGSIRSSSDIINLLLKGTPKLNTLKIDLGCLSSGLYIPYLKFLKKIQFSTSDSFEELTMEKGNRYEKLSINLDVIKMQVSSLSSLQSLEGYVSEPENHLEGLLYDATNLRCLSLETNKTKHKPLDTLKSLEHLEEFQFIFSNEEKLHTDNLAHQIIKKSPRLKRLNLKLSEKQDLSWLNEVKMDQLEDLVIHAKDYFFFNQSVFSSPLPTSFLQNFSHSLIRLHIHGYLEPISDTYKLSFPKLKELKITIRSEMEWNFVYNTFIDSKELSDIYLSFYDPHYFDPKDISSSPGRITSKLSDRFLPRLINFIEHHKTASRLIIRGLDSEEYQSADRMKSFMPHAMVMSGYSETEYDHHQVQVNNFDLRKPTHSNKEFDLDHEIRLDHDVRFNPNTRHTVRRYILHKKLEPENYRLKIMDNLIILDGEWTGLPPKLDESKKEEKVSYVKNLRQEYETRHKDNPDYYYVQLPCKFSSGKPIPLPGVSAQDQLIAYESHPELSLEFYKHSETGQYYLEYKQSEDKENRTPDATISYLITSTSSEEIKHDAVSSVDLMLYERIRFISDGKSGVSLDINPFGGTIFSSLRPLIFQAALKIVASDKFSSSPADLPIDMPRDPIEFFNAMLKTGIGSCRHRAFLIKALAQALDIPCLIIKNECHRYVECRDMNGRWEKFDLGGYEAELDIIEMPKHDPVKEIEAAPRETKEKHDETKKEPKKTYEDFERELLSVLKTKRSALLYLSALKKLQSFSGILMQSCSNRKIPCYAIENLEHITEHSTECKDNKIKTLPSELFQFIQEAETYGFGILIVHCNANSPALLHLYPALDENLKLLGKRIPSAVKIIGLFEKEQIPLIRSELIERFELHPVNKECIDEQIELSYDFIKDHCEIKKESSKDPRFLSLDLSGLEPWQDQILGKFTPLGKEFTWQPGIFESHQKQIDYGTILGIELINPDEEDPALQACLRTLLASFRIFINGHYHQLPKSFKVRWIEKEYDLSKIPEEKLNSEQFKTCDDILNPQNFRNFLTLYHCNENTFYETSGFFSECKKDSLTLVKAHELRSGLLFNFVKKAEQYKISIKLLTIQPKALLESDLPAISLIESSNPCFTARRELHESKKDAELIFIAQTQQYHELIEDFQRISDKEIKREKEEEICALHCRAQATAITQALVEGKTVILAGKISPELTQMLETLTLPKPYLLLNGKKQEIKGKLVLVLPPGLVSIFPHMKKKIIEEKPFFPLAHPEPSKTPAEDEWKENLDRLNKKLKDFRCVWLQGPPATGKTSMIRSLHKNEKAIIFEGIQKLEAWIQAAQDSDKICILLIDEANFQTDETLFDIFEGAFSTKPNIFCKEIYPWKENMKVIFTGNPDHYLGRSSQNILERHPEIILKFNDYSQAYIRKHVLMGMFNQPLTLLAHLDDITKSRVINLILEITKDIKHPVTLRHYQQIFFKFCLFLQKCKEYNLELITQLATYETLGIPTPVHAECFKLSKELDSRASKTIQDYLAAHKEKELILTEEREHTLRLVMDNIEIRNLRLTLDLEYKGEPLDGMRGIALDGPSDCGKTITLNIILNAMGFFDANLAPKGTPSHLLYHVITPLDLHKVDIIFHQGGLIVVNDLDCMITEHKLNSILTGFDEHGSIAKIPGCILLATVNSKERPEASLASKSRILMVKNDTEALKDTKLIPISTHPAAFFYSITEHPDGTPAELPESRFRLQNIP